MEHDLWYEDPHNIFKHLYENIPGTGYDSNNLVQEGNYNDMSWKRGGILVEFD